MRSFRMSGAGNRFAIFDARAQGGLALEPAAARAVAAGGQGFDQVIAIEPSARADAFMRIWNADGSEVGACGNGARCVAWLLLGESGKDQVALETRAGVLGAAPAAGGAVTVDMGAPRLAWDEIPVARAMDTVRLNYAAALPDGGRLEGPGGVNMGNPHAVFFVADIEAVPVRTIGPGIERDPFFPEGVNAGFVQVLARDRLRLRVWERGAGLTRACGSGACAALVAAVRAGHADRKAALVLDGGELTIEWRAVDGHVLMTGPVAWEGEGLA